MKAKEWAEQFRLIPNAMDLYIQETIELSRSRRCKTDAAFEAVFREQEKKLLAIIKLLGEEWDRLDEVFYFELKEQYPTFTAKVDGFQAATYMRKRGRNIREQALKDMREAEVINADQPEIIPGVKLMIAEFALMDLRDLQQRGF